MSGDVTQALQLAFDKLGALAQQYGPKALDLAAQVKQTDAIGELIFTGTLSALFVAGLIGLIFIWRSIVNDDNDDWGGPAIVASFFWAVLLVIIVLRLVDVWTWVALTNPKLALAHDVLSAVTAKASS